MAEVFDDCVEICKAAAHEYQNNRLAECLALLQKALHCLQGETDSSCTSFASSMTCRIKNNIAAVQQELNHTPTNATLKESLVDAITKEHHLKQPTECHVPSYSHNGAMTRYNLAIIFYRNAQSKDALDALHPILKLSTSNTLIWLKSVLLAFECAMELGNIRLALDLVDQFETGCLYFFI